MNKRTLYTYTLSLLFILISTVCTANSSMFTAITNGDIAIVDKLLRDGENPNTRGPNNWTPLLLASAGTKTDIALLLLNAGADPNIAGNQNETPLLYAVMTSNRVLVKELINRGANPNIKNIFGQSPLDMAKVMHWNDITALMTKRNASYVKADVPSENSKLVIIDASAIEKARLDVKKAEEPGYYLGFRDYAVFQSHVSPMRFWMITPYSAIRYGYYRENKTFITFEKKDIQEIQDLKDYVFVQAGHSAGIVPGTIPSEAKNMIIRKSGTIYKSTPLCPTVFSEWGIPNTQIWAFPIGLFDGQDLEIIAIDAWDKQKVMKISADKYRDWK